MALRDPVDRTAAPHQVVTRQPAGVTDTDETGWITVENRVVDAAMEFGTAVHFRLADETATLEAVKPRLDRLTGSDTVIRDGKPEYRATLPADADLVRATLAVDPDETDAWVDRVFNVDEFVVRTDETWVYRSVPHHMHVRELNADAREGLLEAVTAALESIPRSTVVPVDGLVSWQSSAYRYELAWDYLRRAADPSDGDEPSTWTAFELERLEAVRPFPDRTELALRWRPHAADSWTRRAFRRLLQPDTVDPPTRLAVPDRDALDETVDALRRLRDELGYSFTIRGAE